MNKKIKLGSIIQREKEDAEDLLETLYILSRISAHEVLLINLSTGNRWNNDGVQAYNTPEPHVLESELKSKNPSFGEFTVYNKDDLFSKTIKVEAITTELKTAEAIVENTVTEEELKGVISYSILTSFANPAVNFKKVADNMIEDVTKLLKKKKVIKSEKCSDCGVRAKCCKL